MAWTWRCWARAWAWLVLTLGADLFYLTLGITPTLWARGVWFSENDVLHIGLIVWMIYLVRAAAPCVVDAGNGHRAIASTVTLQRRGPREVRHGASPAQSLLRREMLRRTLTAA